MSRVTYKLLAGKDPSRKRLGTGFAKQFPISFSLPAISRVRFQDPDTGEVIVRKIRYCPNETSIFMDEQPKDAKPEKLKFEYGFMSIDKISNSLKYQFAELIDMNATKEGRDKSKTPLFERVDLAKKAQESLAQEKDMTSVVQEFFGLSNTEKECVAAMWGMKTHNTPQEVWMFELFKKVQANPREFKNLLSGGDMSALGTIVEGQHTGVLTYHNYKWSFRDTDLLKVPVGLKPALELMKYLQIHADTQEAIDRASREVRERFKKKSSIEEEVEVYSSEEILDMGMKAKVVFYDKGKGWKFVEPYDGMDESYVFGGINRKDAAVDFIKENNDVKMEIYLRRKEALATKAKERKASSI